MWHTREIISAGAVTTHGGVYRDGDEPPEIRQLHCHDDFDKVWFDGTVVWKEWDENGVFLGVFQDRWTDQQGCGWENGACFENVLKQCVPTRVRGDLTCTLQEGQAYHALVCNKTPGKGGTIDSYDLSCGKIAGTNGTVEAYKINCGRSENQIVSASIVY